MLIALFSAEPLDALWLTIAFTALQQIEGHIVAPNVFAQALRINPLLVIFALLLGGQLYGFIGAFIALPIAAMVRETVVYFRRHLGARAVGTLPSRSPVGWAGRPCRRPGARCPECGAALRRGADVCPACGTELAAPDAEAAAASTGALDSLDAPPLRADAVSKRYGDARRAARRRRSRARDGRAASR